MDFFWASFKFLNRRKTMLIVFLLILISLSAFFATRLQFTEDITKMLPHSKQVEQFGFVYANSKFLDKLIFNISLKDSEEEANPALLSQYANEFSDSLERRFVPSHLKSVDKLPNNQVMQQAWDFVIAHLPLFLDEKDYGHIDSLLFEDQLSDIMENNYKTLISPVGFVSKKRLAIDPLQLSFLGVNKFRDFQAGDNFIIYNDHIVSADKRNLLLIITPAEANNTAANQVMVDGIDELIAGLSTAEYEGIQVQYFGNAVVALGNAQRIKKDIILTLSLALSFLLIFISLFFRRLNSFILVFLPVLFGALVSLATLYLFKHEVSAISLGIGSVLLGISVDYGLHILSHHRKYHDTKALIKDISLPILLSSFTTSAAFFILHFTDSKALNDLGLFAAISVLAAALFSVFVLPHLLSNKASAAKEDKRLMVRWVDHLAASKFSSSKYIKLGIFACTILFLFTSRDVPFDADMMKANYMSEDLKRAEQDLNLVTNLSKKSIYLVAPGRTLEKALLNSEKTTRLIDSLKQIGVVQNASTITSIYKSEQAQLEAIAIWDAFWKDKKQYVTARIGIEADKYGFKANAFDAFEQLLNMSFRPLDSMQQSFLVDLVAANYLIQTDSLSAIINVVKVNNNPDDIASVHKVFEGKDFAWVVDKQSLTSASVRMLKDIFDKLILYSLGLVFVILLIAYGRIELTLITMIPIVVSWVWTIGLMGLFGISFNIFNVVILTFIFGLGIDYSIFIMRGLIQNYKYGEADLSSYKVSVILSGVTTLAGIGVLIFAQHPALKSIALMSIIGVLSVIFVTFSLLPAIFKWLVSYQEGLRNRPVTLVDFLFSIMSLLIFMSGALIMSFMTFVLKPIPINEAKKKYFFHWLFMLFTRILIRANVLSKEHYENKEIANYGKPAVIIANHQSHIDLMLMMLIDPRVVVLTNSRNYNNPVYGRALQYADFELSDEDNEQMIASLRKKVAAGYSILVFPEGTRSGSGKIRRFHKGAFHIARELGIDIQPIIIHGQGQLLKKSEFFLKRGNVVTRFLPRIDLSKNEYGTTLRDQTKGVQAYFRREFYKVKMRVESPKFYKDYLKKNYLYKGPVLEWYTKIKVRMENNFEYFNDLIPRQSRITDLGCGYGYLSYMLSLCSEERSVVAIDYDEEKIALANHCAIKNDRIEFVTADILEYHFEASDVFILNDVLHYMPAKLQLEVIGRCTAKLNAGGMIVIRDGSKDLEKRHKVTRFSERLSTGIGFNKTKFELEFLSRENYQKIAADNGLDMEVVDKEDATSNLVFILRKT